MSEAEFRDLLGKASGIDQPSNDFVESLWSELDSAMETGGNAAQHSQKSTHVRPHGPKHPESDPWVARKPDRTRSGPVVALAAAAIVLLVGLLGALLASIDQPGTTASAPAPTQPAEDASPVTVDDVAAEEDLSPLARKCDRLLVSNRVAAVLRPGVATEASSYRPSRPIATDVSTIELQSLIRAIEQLSDIDELRSDVRARHSLGSATSALDQAILLIEMGEPTLAHESIDQAKTTLGELASESALDGCLETVS